MPSIAVFASGNGSNFQAIVEALQTTRYRVGVLVCDKPAAKVLDRAQRADIPVVEIRYRSGTPREKTERELIELLIPYEPELIVLAGFMRLLTPCLIDTFRNRILNIHPSLLPKYPGLHGIEESWSSSDPELGVTVHLVDYGLDTGSILRQERIPRIPNEPLSDCETRIHALEHRLYPEVILSFLEGDLLQRGDTHRVNHVD